MDTLDVPTQYTFTNQAAMMDWLLSYFSISPPEDKRWPNLSARIFKMTVKACGLPT
jgi:hypothetical protein